MIGHGCPSQCAIIEPDSSIDALHRKMCSIVAICAFLIFCLVSFKSTSASLLLQSTEGNTYTAAILPTHRTAVPISDFKLRVTWGGEQSINWQGTITLTEGAFVGGFRPLGMSFRAASTIHVDNQSITINQKEPLNFNGLDVGVNAPLTATLEVDLIDPANPTRRLRRQFTLAELVHQSFDSIMGDSNNRFSISRTPGDKIQVEFDQDHLVFQSGSQSKLTVTAPHAGMETFSSGQIKLSIESSEAGRVWSSQQKCTVNAKGELSLLPPIDIPIPQTEGVYNLTVTLYEKRHRGPFPVTEEVCNRQIQFVVLDPLPPANEENAKLWKEQVVLDPTKPDKWRRWWQFNQLKYSAWNVKAILGNNQIEETEVDGQPMAKLLPGGWQSYVIPIDEPGQPCLIEIEYRASQPMSMAVNVMEPDRSRSIPVFGCDSGVVVPRTVIGVDEDAVGNPIRRHQLVVWTNSKTPCLMLANLDQNHAAVFGKIRVLSGPKRLSRADLPLTKAKNTRRILASLDEPSFAKLFSAPSVSDSSLQIPLDDWTTVYHGADRLVQYLKAHGYSGLMMTAAAKDGTIYPSELLTSTPVFDNGVFFSSGQDVVQKDVLELLFRMFDREGLVLVPVIEFSGSITELENQYRQNPSIDLSDESGNPIRESISSQFRRPPYNPLNESVQRSLIAVTAELANRYKDHRSFQGVGIGFRPESAISLPNPYWGADPESIRRFKSEMTPTGLNNGDPNDHEAAHAVDWCGIAGAMVAVAAEGGYENF